MKHKVHFKSSQSGLKFTVDGEKPNSANADMFLKISAKLFDDGLLEYTGKTLKFDGEVELEEDNGMAR